MAWWTPMVDAPYNEQFTTELLQPSIVAARIAHQWRPLPPDVLFGDTQVSTWYQLPQTPGQIVTQNAYYQMYRPDGTKTNNHNFSQSTRTLADQAAFLKLMGPNLLGAP